MFVVNSDKSIYLTRGDIATLNIGVINSSGEAVEFVEGDLIRLRVFTKNQHDNVVIQKDVVVDHNCVTVDISLSKDDTKIGPIINKPVDYWYDIEVNPETTPQTIIGYDINGPKVFRLFPEGGDIS